MVSKNAEPVPEASSPRKRESRRFKILLDPRLRGGDVWWDFFDTLSGKSGFRVKLGMTSKGFCKRLCGFLFGSLRFSA